MKKLLLHIFLLVNCLFSQAQKTNYLFHYLGQRDGLMQGHVSGLCQDRRGFIWLASQNCIQRYDGFQFINFYPGQYQQLPQGVISGMALGSKNRLWVLTGTNGLGYIDTDNLSYHAVKVTLPERYQQMGAAALQTNKAGGVTLIFPGKGVLTYNETAGEVAEKYNPFVFPAGWEPRHLWQDDDLNYWAASANGILKYNTRKKQLSYAGHNEENEPAITAYEKVTNTNFVYKDNANRIWVNHWQPGLHVTSFNPVNGEMISWESIIGKSIHGAYYECWGVRQLQDGSLWANGPNLFTRLNYEQRSSSPVLQNASGEYSIRYEEVYNLFEDRENSVWVCTNKGLFRFNPSAHIFHAVSNRLPGDETVYKDDVTAIQETTDGEILVSTWGRGIFCYDKNLDPIVSKYAPHNSPGEGMIWCMLQSRNGDIWRAGQDGSLFRYDAAARTNSAINAPVFQQRTIRQITEDKDGNVWFGTQGGQLIKWNSSTKTFSLQQKWKSIITRLITGSNNHLWICTDNNGVYCVNAADGSVLHHYHAKDTENKKLLHNGASDIVQFNDSTILIASNGLNILNTNTGTFRYWHKGEQIVSLIKDKNNIVWMATATGVIAQYMISENKYMVCNASDGVSNTDFNIGAGKLLKDGRIVFGTNTDFLVFDPAQCIKIPATFSTIQVAGISVMNRWIPVDSVLQLQQLTINHDENAVMIRLTSNNYQVRLPLFYMIDGLDETWKQTPPNGEIALNYLSPGKYNFKATIKDLNGNNGDIISITIVVKPPFYKTWWFLGLLTLTIAAVFFIIDRERVRRREALQKMRSNIAGNLQQEVNKALSNINVLSEMARMKADRDIEKSKEFIEQIHSKSQYMMVTLDDMLWSVDPANDSMEKTVHRMQEFIAAANTRCNAAITMQANEQVKKLDLNMDQRHELLLLFRQLVNDAAAAGISDINILAYIEKKFLVLKFTCNNDSCMQKADKLFPEWEHRIYNKYRNLGSIIEKTGNGFIFRMTVK